MLYSAELKEKNCMKVDFDYRFNRILFVNSYICNMNCPYCMHMAHKKNAKIKPGMQFGLEKSKELFDTFIENTPYDKVQITFSGGEPLVFYKDYIKPMILHMRQREKETGKEVKLDMFTNGTLLTEEMLDFFKENEFIVTVSYDGHCGQDYRDAKTKDTVEEKIKMGITKNGSLFGVASTFYRDSLPYMYDAYLTVANMGAAFWSFAIDTLSTNTEPYNTDDCKVLGDQINKIWNDLPNHNMSVNTFDRVLHFDEYVESNRAIIARPDGEICIGTTVPILIPEDIFPLFSIGYWQVDGEKFKRYTEIMGDFHIHPMGRNHPSFCETCKLKASCCDVKRTSADMKVRACSDPMHCMEYLILSHIVEGNW